MRRSRPCVSLTADVEPDELIAFCRERMAAYKYPRVVEIVDELPKSATGKILRRELRETAEVPGVLRAVLRAERALGEPLMRATNSREAAGALLLIGQAAGLARDGAERTRFGVVHALALRRRARPAAARREGRQARAVLDEFVARERMWSTCASRCRRIDHGIPGSPRMVASRRGS